MRQLFNILVSVISIAASYYSLPAIAALPGKLSDPTKAAQYISNGIINAGGISVQAGESEA
jgi:hypothetical protein